MRSRSAAAQNGGVGRFPFLTGLAALGQHTGRAARMPATRGSTFASTHRVADRIHRRAAVVRPATQPALAPRLAYADVHVVGIADRPDGRPAIGADSANFSGRQSDLRPATFTRRQGCAGARTATQLPSAPRL